MRARLTRTQSVFFLRFFSQIVSAPLALTVCFCLYRVAFSSFQNGRGSTSSRDVIVIYTDCVPLRRLLLLLLFSPFFPPLASRFKNSKRTHTERYNPTAGEKKNNKKKKRETRTTRMGMKQEEQQSKKSLFHVTFMLRFCSPRAGYIFSTLAASFFLSFGQIHLTNADAYAYQ